MKAIDIRVGPLVLCCRERPGWPLRSEAWKGEQDSDISGREGFFVAIILFIQYLFVVEKLFTLPDAK